MEVNRNYYEYDRTLVNGAEISKSIRDLTNFKLNEEIDTSIFFVQNNTNPNHVKPSSAYVRYEPQSGSDVNRVWYNPNSSYGTLQSGDNDVNPPISELFDKNMKVRLALCRYSSSIAQNDRIGYSATTIPSGLSYTCPWLNNNYKKIIVVVYLGCYRVKYGSVTTGVYTVLPYKYDDNLVAKVADGTYPDIETAKLYNPIIGINAYIGYFDDTTNTWRKLSEYDGILFDITHKNKNLYYLHNLLFDYGSSGSPGTGPLPIGNAISITRTSNSTGASASYYKNFMIRNERDVPYWKGSIPQFELTDWEAGRMQVIHNTMDNKYNPDDLRYWQIYDYSVTTTKYTHLYCCITMEGVKRYIASLGLFFTTNGLPNINTDLSDLDNLPNYIHMPEVTANGFTTNNYFSGKEIGKSNSPNKNWTSTTDSTIKVNAESGDGDNVENLELAIGNTYVNSFVRMYAMTRNQVAQLSEEFSNPTNSIPVGKNPFDNIIGLQQFPIDLSTQALGSAENIVIDTWDTNVSAIKVNGCIPSRLIGRYTIDRQYNNFLDFEPYTTAELYIPMCGRIQLPLNYLMGKSFEVFFIQDIENGACKAIVKCDQISAEIVGDLSESVVITAQNQGIKKQSIMDSAISAAGCIASTAVSGLTDNIGGAAAGAAAYMSGIAGTIAAFNANYSIIKGASTAKCNFINVPTCYIKITRPTVELPANYGHTVGYVANITKKLSEVHGYTICNNPDVQCNLTAAEKQKLKNYLQSGVYLP